MIGLVVVSHSALLAEGVCELASQVGQGKLRLAAAGGTADKQNPFGTDAFRVLNAIESVYDDDGVILFMDLGSAVLSAETALELLPEERRSRVRLCSAPLVEGTVAAATLAASGAGLEEILHEAQAALSAKSAQLGAVAPASGSEERLVTLVNPLGLHARPAAQFVRLARSLQVRVTVENLSRETAAVDAAGINGILGLGARQGHQLRLRADGLGASEALSRLSAFLASGFGEESESAAPERAPAQEGRLAGMAASPGIVIGPLVRMRPMIEEGTRRKVEYPAAELERFEAALRGAQEETRSLWKWAVDHAGEREAGIFDAQALFLEDAELLTAVSGSILQGGNDAGSAWRSETGKLASRLSSLEDPYLRARAADITDVAERILRRLSGQTAAPVRPTQPSILAASDLAPSEVKELDPRLVLGLCLEAGSPAAHSLILARAIGIPAVVGLGRSLAAIPEGTTVALDGEAGVVWISPEPGQVRLIETRARRWNEDRREAAEERHKRAFTRDGHRIRVVANISSVAEAAEAAECGADGVGVLRTEFLFLGRTTAPGEEEQLAAYRAIADSLKGRPVVIRTLDAGGDKDLPYAASGAEANPFLGCRGIRLTLAHPDLFRTQIRAILRTAADRRVEILLPMVSTVDEVLQVKTLIKETEAGLQHARIASGRNVKVGVMIEVPAAAAIADRLAAEAGFFSIGTNDLIQYAMAADRTNGRVASLADPFQPAVLHLIRQTVEAARRTGIEVALCGELAADPLATPLLLGLGLEEFSVSARFVAGLKRSIARWSRPEAESIARDVLALDTAGAVRRILVEVSASK